MIIHKSNEANEAGIPPSKELIEGVRRMVGEAVQQGVLLAGEGVHASSKGARLSYSGGKFTVTPADWDRLNAFISSQACLREQRGREEQPRDDTSVPRSARA